LSIKHFYASIKKRTIIMKTHTLTILLTFICSFTFSQQVIENPEYGFSTYPGEITKIEILDTTTVLHFKLKTLPWGYFHLHKESYIQDLSGDNKLFVSKVTGAKFKRNDFPPSGEVIYQLYFPPLSKTVKTIDFGVEKERGWQVHDIILEEDENSLLSPKELRGNWLLADGSNRWDYGFNSKYAIVDGAIWNYKSVNKKGKKYIITIEKEGALKAIYAKLEKDGNVAFGNTPKALESYSLTKIFNPNFIFKDDTEFENIVFGLDSTTYSGMIKGFSNRMEQKTAMVYVNNAFKGGQESYLVKIKDDGSFQSKFPLTHPQTIFMRMGSSAYTLFLEPNKETFHYINRKESLFMGENAQVNSDLDALNNIRLNLSRNAHKKIGETAPEDYKKTGYDLREKARNELVTYQKNNGVSKKGLQIKSLDLELSFYQLLLGYDMYRGSLQRQNEKAKKEADKMPYQEFEISESYYDFLPKDVADNRLYALSNGYYFFVNRLMYADLFETELSSKLTKVEIADWLMKKGIELTPEELNMVEFSKQIETPEILAKEAGFEKEYGDIEQGFYKKYKDYFKEVSTYLKAADKPSNGHFILSAVDYFEENGIEITDEETEMVEALKVLKTRTEIEEERLFNQQFKDVIKPFYNKYSENSSDIYMARRSTARDTKLKAFFGKENAFLFDVIKMQDLSKPFEDYKVYSDEALIKAQQEVKTPFFRNYLAVSNEQTKEKIEINKTKGGYTVHNVEKNEGNELFDAMIEKFKGKVVYVDFWATWCGPCKSGITKIAPLKEEMKDEDVVFLYVTNQTSPEGTWKNSIPNIKGEHYRVSADEWNYLTEKFKISGIPHYTLVNKKGEVVKPKMGHLSNDRLKTVLKSEMEK
jgi:thiol-disulfide isomerase/thioredoxin